MSANETPLAVLTARDVMSHEVVTIPREMSLRAAAHLLRQLHISGAPVVDETGRCVGLLSATDLIKWIDGGGQVPNHQSADSCFAKSWGLPDPEQLPTDRVANFMSTALVTGSAGMRIPELAGLMMAMGVHRVIITDERNRPVGVVTGTDLIRMLAESDAGDPAANGPSAGRA